MERASGGQAAVAAYAHEHEPLVEERIRMMDYATTQAWSEGVISTPYRQWDLAEAIHFSPLPTVDEMDRLYRQLAEIHTIGAAQLAECAHWSRYDSTPSPIRVRTSRQGHDETPSATWMAPPPPTNFSPPHALLQQQNPHVEPSMRQRACQVGT
jgi:hypothetical protein